MNIVALGYEKYNLSYSPNLDLFIRYFNASSILWKIASYLDTISKKQLKWKTSLLLIVSSRLLGCLRGEIDWIM